MNLHTSNRQAKRRARKRAIIKSLTQVVSRSIRSLGPIRNDEDGYRAVCEALSPALDAWLDAHRPTPIVNLDDLARVTAAARGDSALKNLSLDNGLTGDFGGKRRAPEAHR